MKEISGFFLVDKPAKMSSNDLVQTIKNQFRFKKVGHCGTLDPMATGLMIILVNQATKISEYFLSNEKGYYFTVNLFVKTTTLDSEGKVCSRQAPFKLSSKQLDQIVNKYNGYIYSQYPPKYSAIKINGQKLYELARNQKPIPEIKPRKVSIYSLKLINYDSETNQIKFYANVSKGTYIRSLAEDMLAELGIDCYVSELRRVSSGNFKIENAKTLQLLKLENILTLYQGIIINNLPIYQYKNVKDIYQGKSIQLLNAKEDEVFIFSSNRQIIAIYKKVYKNLYKCKRGLWNKEDFENLSIAEKEDLYG